MTIRNFFKIQVFALLFSAIISPLSVLADTKSQSATIKIVLGTKEVFDYEKLSCPPYNLGGTVSGIGTGTITVNDKSKRLGLLSLSADDCITPTENKSFTADGNMTLTASNGDNIKAHYQVTFVPIKEGSIIYKYKNFNLQAIEGTGIFKIATGSTGIVEGASNIVTGLGVIEATITIPK